MMFEVGCGRRRSRSCRSCSPHRWRRGVGVVYRRDRLLESAPGGRWCRLRRHPQPGRCVERDRAADAATGEPIDDVPPPPPPARGTVEGQSYTGQPARVEVGRHHRHRWPGRRGQGDSRLTVPCGHNPGCLPTTTSGRSMTVPCSPSNTRPPGWWPTRSTAAMCGGSTRVIRSPGGIVALPRRRPSRIHPVVQSPGPFDGGRGAAVEHGLPRRGDGRRGSADDRGRHGRRARVRVVRRPGLRRRLSRSPSRPTGPISRRGRRR